MKSSIEFRQILRRPFSGAVATTVLGLAFALTSQAQPASPEGTWDMVSSGGGQKGIAQFEFSAVPDTNGLFHFSVSQIQAPILKSSSGFTESRGTTDESRTGTGTETTPQTNTVVFGFSHTDSGMWSYDSEGRVVGAFTQPLVGSGSTNVTVNAISFVGKVVPGKRLTLVASTSFGKVTYRGTPRVSLTDISGAWSGLKTQEDQLYLEFFTLTPFGIPNVYTVDGQGPGYVYSTGLDPITVCMVSSHGKIGFSILERGGSNTNGLLRATVGSFINSKSTIGAKTKGIIEPTTKVRFNANLQ